MKRPNKWIFLLFFAVSLFLYSYRSQKMFTFDADQEFYANEYIQIVDTHKFTLLGIETSVGGMFVGPLYTYASTFVYWAFRGDPTGIFLVTLFFASFQPSLTYHLFTKLKNEKVGLLAGILVLLSSSLWSKAFAPSAINFLYPMGLIFFYILVKLNKDSKYFLWLGIVLAATLQIHFSLFFFLPITILYMVWRRSVTKKNAKNLFNMLILISISISPLVIFDLRHRFFIANNLWKFVNNNAAYGNSVAIAANIFGVFTGLVELFSHILMPAPTIFVYILLILILIYTLAKIKKDFSYKVIGLIYTVSIFLFLLYRGPKPDYFFYFLLAPFFFATADFVSSIAKNKFLKYPVILLLFILAVKNLQFMNSAVNDYNYDLKKQVGKYIKEESEDKRVKISYDTELGLGFGFDYLLRYAGVNIDNENFEENYHIVIKRYENYPGREFKESGSPVSIKVVKLSKNI